MPDEQAPLNPDLMGYPSVEALVAAKRASDQEAVRLKQRADRADELERLIVSNATQANPRQNVPDRSQPRWRQELEAAGVPTDPIVEAFREMGREIVQEELQPVYRMGTARNKMVAKYKDYSQFENDIGNFITSDPQIQETYNRVFNADPVAAFEWAYHEFGENRRQHHIGNGGAPPVAGAEHASIPSQRSGDTRAGGQYDANIGLEQAAQAYRENPNKYTAEAYAKQRLRGIVTDEHLLGGMSGR